MPRPPAYKAKKTKLNPQERKDKKERDRAAKRRMIANKKAQRQKEIKAIEKSTISSIATLVTEIKQIKQVNSNNNQKRLVAIKKELASLKVECPVELQELKNSLDYYEMWIQQLIVLLNNKPKQSFKIHDHIISKYIVGQFTNIISHPTTGELIQSVKFQLINLNKMTESEFGLKQLTNKQFFAIIIQYHAVYEQIEKIISLIGKTINNPKNSHSSWNPLTLFQSTLEFYRITNSQLNENILIILSALTESLILIKNQYQALLEQIPKCSETPVNTIEDIIDLYHSLHPVIKIRNKQLELVQLLQKIDQLWETCRPNMRVVINVQDIYRKDEIQKKNAIAKDRRLQNNNLLSMIRDENRIELFASKETFSDNNNLLKTHLVHLSKLSHKIQSYHANSTQLKNGMKSQSLVSLSMLCLFMQDLYREYSNIQAKTDPSCILLQREVINKKIKLIELFELISNDFYLNHSFKQNNPQLFATLGWWHSIVNKKLKGEYHKQVDKLNYETMKKSYQQSQTIKRKKHKKGRVNQQTAGKLVNLTSLTNSFTAPSKQNLMYFPIDEDEATMEPKLVSNLSEQALITEDHETDEVRKSKAKKEQIDENILSTSSDVLLDESDATSSSFKNVVIDDFKKSATSSIEDTNTTHRLKTYNHVKTHLNNALISQFCLFNFRNESENFQVKIRTIIDNFNKIQFLPEVSRSEADYLFYTLRTFKRYMNFPVYCGFETHSASKLNITPIKFCDVLLDISNVYHQISLIQKTLKAKLLLERISYFFIIRARACSFVYQETATHAAWRKHLETKIKYSLANMHNMYYSLLSSKEPFATQEEFQTVIGICKNKFK